MFTDQLVSSCVLEIPEFAVDITLTYTLNGEDLDKYIFTI